MDILITAGGTTEKIDDVRKITNSGTGRLGAMTADCFACSDLVENIYYVCSEKSILPTNDKTNVIFADDTLTLEKTIDNLCHEKNFDVVVHSMAVSDYRVKTVATAEKVEEKNDGLINLVLDTKCSSEDHGGKISSDNENLVVIMEKTPKIISNFRRFLPEAIIFGFKLLVDVSEDELIEVAFKLLSKNDCDYVVANDLRYTGQDNHIAHIVDRDKKYHTVEGKNNIAQAICDTAISLYEEGISK